MASEIWHVTIDCADPFALGSFWAQALGVALAYDDAPGDPKAQVSARGARLLFVRVPEAKSTKNRVHLDIRPAEGNRDAEVERLLTIGASVHEDHRRADGTGWVTMLDPEGNEFCVVRSAAEREGCRTPPTKPSSRVRSHDAI